MRGRTLSLVAAATSLSLGAQLTVLVLDPPPGALRSYVFAAGYGLVSAASVLLWWIRPDHEVARRFLLFGLANALFGSLGALTAYVPDTGYSLHAAVGVALIEASECAFLAMLAVLPDGSYASAWQRSAMRLFIAGSAVATVAVVLSSAEPVMPAVWAEYGAGPGGNALSIPALSALEPVAQTAMSVLDAVLLAGLLLPILRYRRAGTVVRSQLRVLGLTLAAVAFGITTVLVLSRAAELQGMAAATVSGAAGLVALLGVLAAVAVSVSRYRLFDVEAVVRRSVVHAAACLVITVAYLGVAAALGIAASNRLPVIAVVLVTIAATLGLRPFRSQLTSLASRRILGSRPDAYDLLTEFGQGLEHAFVPTDLAARISEALREGLGVEWAQVRLNVGTGARPILDAESSTSAPALGPAAVEVPIVHAGELLGVIRCGPKGLLGFGEDDRRLLDTLARQAGLALYNAMLASELSARLDEIGRQADELAASRTRLVAAQDAERRRIERNIHDGVQQEIASLLTKLRLARNQLRRDPALADATLEEMQAEARCAMEEIRELARGIHPPVLADRGLLEAVEAKAARVAIGVTIDADPALREERLSDEVETAAYFFVSETLANVVKHASASSATVRLQASGDMLRLEVSDDGIGFLAADVVDQGGGLVGLRDRLAASGGLLRVDSRPGCGTRVQATLPRIARVRAGR